MPCCCRPHDLQADESLLTGESVPVRKTRARRADAGRGAAARRRRSAVRLFRLAGRARQRRSPKSPRPGARSEIGKIGQSLGALQTEAAAAAGADPPAGAGLRRRSAPLSACWSCVLYGTLRGGWLDALLAGIALGMSMLPEEFPVVLTVFMAMGAWRISQARVLTRRAAAIETLGSATVLCTDKTGTLTENRMSVAELRLPTAKCCAPRDARRTLPDAFRDTARGRPARQRARAVRPDGEGASTSSAGEHLPRRQRTPRAAGARLRAAPRSAGDVAGLARRRRPGDFIVAAKGAPEAIAELCRLDRRRRCAALSRDRRRDGARRPARARRRPRRRHPASDWPETQHGFRLRLPRPGRPRRSAARAVPGGGRRMPLGRHPRGHDHRRLSGDRARRSRAQAGLDAGDVVTGDELAALDDAALAQRLRTRHRVRADHAGAEAAHRRGAEGRRRGRGDDRRRRQRRAVAEGRAHRHRHGRARHRRGARGRRRSCCSTTISPRSCSAIRLGRRIYDNLRKAMGFIFAVHVPIAGLALLPLLFGLPILLGPIHIAFLEMIIDPVCSLVFEAEAEEDDVMRRPPRDPEQPLFSARADRLEPAAGRAGVRAGRRRLRRSASTAGCRRRSARADVLRAGADRSSA